MSLHETDVKTTMIGYLAGNIHEVKVFISDELNETSPYDLAYSSTHGGYLPYLFTGYFYDNKYRRWFFSNARQHEEMKNAVFSLLDKETNCVYGQLRFDDHLMEEGKLKFDVLIVNDNLPNGVIEQLRREVRRDRFGKYFHVVSLR